ncbi:sulfur carrier protein ThiS [Alteromonas sp. P256]|uniref:sulfur carrier protein ThiS n=1 Tax=Alteromonas sp. P256 TaxID=3117399 RepID=UPI002FE0F010
MNSTHNQSNNIHTGLVKNVASAGKNDSAVTNCTDVANYTDVTNCTDVSNTSKKHPKSNAETTTITIVLNNQSQTCESPISVGEIVHGYASNVEGTAIAYNHSILSKSQWSLTHLQDGDHIDIFTLVAGG